VSIAACLLLYSLVVLIVGPALLSRLTDAGYSPRLGAAAWMTAISSVVVSWVGAVASAVADFAHHWDHPGAVLAICFGTLRGLAAGTAGTAIQIGLWSLAGLGALAVAVSAGRVLRTLGRMRSQTHGHARAVHLVGRRVTGLDALVLDAAEPAAYCVAGRPHVVVVTTGALDTLSERELAAILAHEQAHLDGHHPQIVAVARSLAATFANLRLMIEGAHHISRLLEMCADDRAAGAHGRGPILRGLLALTGAAPVAAGALGATEVAVLARAERLASEPRANLGRTAAMTAVITITAGGPLAAALVAVSGALCGSTSLL
jgi:Zn-dependent protease with chaperone function